MKRNYWQLFKSAYRLRQIENTIGLAIEQLHRGYEIGIDPAKLCKEFMERYNEVYKDSSIRRAYDNLTNQELQIIYFIVPRIVNELRKNPTFGASDLDKALGDLWLADDRREQLEREATLGFGGRP